MSSHETVLSARERGWRSFRRWRRGARAWLALLAVLLLAGSAAAVVGFGDFVFEDSFITYRYASNLAAGEGFAFNPGERVLGTSSPLLALLLALLALCGIPPHVGGGLLFVLGWSGAAALGAFLLRRAGHPTLGLLFAAVLMTGFAGIYRFWGMETTLYCAALLAGVAAAVERRTGLAGVLLGCVGLLRYDGVLAAAALGALLLFERRRIPWRYVAGGLLVAAPWLLFAHLYFGSILPQTLAAKAGAVTPSEYLAEVWRAQVGGWWPRALPRPPGWLLAMSSLALASLLAALVSAGRLLRRSPALLAPLGTALALPLAYSLIAPPTRHLWHLVPASVLLLFAGLLGLGELLATRTGRPWRPAGSALVVVGASMAALLLVPSDGRDLRQRGDYYGRPVAYRAMADFLVRSELQDRVVMTREPGVLAYWSGVPVVDLVGLVTPGERFHGASDRERNLHRALRRWSPDFLVNDPGASPGSPSWRYHVLAYEAFPARQLLVDGAVWAGTYRHVAERWRAGPSSPGARLRHPFQVELSPPSLAELARLGGFWTGAPRRHESAMTEAKLLWTAPERSVWAGGETPTFEIDFDLLAFDLCATHPTETAAQLVMDGQILLQETADGECGVERMRRVYWPVAAWRGRAARLRFVDVGPSGHAIAAGDVRSLRGQRPIALTPFRSRAPAAGAPSPEVLTTPLLPLVAEHGLAVLLDEPAASSLAIPGLSATDSAELRIERDGMALLLLDLCDARCELQLRVDGRIRRRVRGSGTGRWRAVVWGVGNLRGRSAVLTMVDRDPEPGRGVGVAAVQLFDWPAEERGE